MLDNKNTKGYLNSFAKYVIQQSRSNLTKGGKNNQKKLYNSLDKEIEVGANSFRLAFLMEDYAEFVDKGVQGKTSSTKAPNSPFKFGTGTGKQGGLTQGIDKWVRQKRIQFREKEGKGVKGQLLSYSQTSFLIRRAIWNKGIKPSLFFTKPFEKAFERLPDELIEAYGLDVEQFLQYTINKK
jgi:hypothetical protein